jgi:hypothetical protein
VDSHFEVKTADQEPFLISEKGKKLEKTGTTLRRRKKKRTKALNSSENSIFAPFIGFGESTYA